MIHPDDNGHSPVVTEEPPIPATEAPGAPPQPGAPQPFATRAKLRPPQVLGQNKVVLIAGGAIVVALLLFVFSSAPTHKRVQGRAKQVANSQQTDASQPNENPDQQKSMFPVIESARVPAKSSNNGLVAEQDLEHTATHQPPPIKSYPQPKNPENGTLGAIQPFDNQGAWQAPPYQSASNTTTPILEPTKSEREQSSLVFVQKVSQPGTANPPLLSVTDPSSAVGLPIGTRLRARLETAASTAVKTPVIAVIEYSYEKEGEIVLQAGTKVFGRIEQADRSGYISIRFDALRMPDGSWAAVDAAATNLNLGPLRGKVEGKNSGKNVFVRSLSGIGEVGALLAGRSGSVNQPFSEGDMIRERVATNIGESADQEVTRLAVTEHIVVTVPANTPLYVVLDRTSKPPSASEQTQRSASVNSTASADSLRQLLQLQRELNQSTDMSSH